jgi:two-component sensor histidine kinase
MSVHVIDLKPAVDGLGPAATAELPPVLLAAPRAPDRSVLAVALHESGLPVLEEGDPMVWPADQVLSAGCLVLTQEALTTDFRDRIAPLLEAQPTWSELPVVALLERGRSGDEWREALQARWLQANVPFLIRPLAGLELQSAVQLAISARLRQFRIRDQMAQERVLRFELNHRVKNILATVQSIANSTRRTAEGNDAFDRFGERLAALGRGHEGLERVAAEGETFESLVRAVLAPYLATNEGHFAIAGPSDPLESSVCNMLGLCLFELATNSAKHGASSIERGRIAVELTRVHESVRFSWTESDGPAVAAPTRHGYGTRFLRMALSPLFGATPRFDYDPRGFRLSIDGPADGLFAAAAAS